MSNDMTRELNNPINLSKNTNFSGKTWNVNTNTHHENQNYPEQNSNHDIDMEKSMNCMLGKAQINSQNPIEEISPQVQKSVEEFLSDSDFIEAHTNLTDELVKRGYCLEEAIIRADMIFESLKKGEIYQI